MPVVDNIERSAKRRIKRQHNDCAILYIALNQKLRQHRNAKPFRDGLNDCLRADAFPHRTDRQMMQRKRGIENFPTRTSRLPHQKWLLRQLRQRHRRLLRKRRPRRYDRAKFVFQKRRSLQIRMFRLRLDQTDIDRIV